MDAPLLALVAHGNDALAHGEAPELLLACSAFRRLRTLEAWFADGSPPLAGTAAWLEELAARSATRLDLVVDLRVGLAASAFQGGLGWSLETRYPHHATRWTAEWVHEQGAGQPFRLVLAEGAPRPLGLVATGDGALAAAAGSLDLALATAQRFSDEHGLRFGWRLADARTSLAAPDPRPANCIDLLPARGYPLGARRLLAAVDRGWVFGGMKSWNDRAFADEDVQDAFERASANLLHALTIAAASGANAYRADVPA